MPLNIADVAEGAKKDLHALALAAYDEITPVYPRIWTVTNDGEGMYEQETSVVALSTLLETPYGQEPQADDLTQGYTVVAKTFQFGRQLAVNPDTWRNAKKLDATLQKIGPMWADAHNRTMEEQAAIPFNHGGKTAGYSWFNGTVPGVVTDSAGNFVYDGKPMFNLSNNTRSGKVSGTYYNGLALTLTQANVQTAYLLGTDTNAYDERGNRISLDFDTLLIPASAQFTADVLIKTDRVTTSANNDINPLQGMFNPIVWRQLTTSTAWYLGKAGYGLHIKIVRPLTLDTDIDKKTEVITFLARAEVQFIINNWRGWVGSNVPTS